jgi:hypothetical protein
MGLGRMGVDMLGGRGGMLEGRGMKGVLGGVRQSLVLLFEVMTELWK